MAMKTKDIQENLVKKMGTQEYLPTSLETIKSGLSKVS